LESDNISTTPFYTLDAIDDEIFALIVKSEKDEDWKEILQNNSIKDRLTSQGIIALERNEIRWDDATLLFTLGLKLDNNNIPIKLGDLKNRERFGRFPSIDGSALNYFSEYTKATQRDSSLVNRPTFDELMVLINKLNKGLENTSFSSGIGGLRIHGWITSEEATELRKAIKSGQWGVASDEPLDGGVRDIIKHVVAILRSAERNQVGLMLRSHS
tara:strand:- start:2275 stop:2919 length:645 start_codon:yes stop_codon:yes gene_type:complete